MPRYCPRRVEAIVNVYLDRARAQPPRLATASERAAQPHVQGAEAVAVHQRRRHQGDAPRRVEDVAQADVRDGTRVGVERLHLPLSGGLAHLLVALADTPTELCTAFRHFRSSRGGCAGRRIRAARRLPGWAAIAPP